MYLGYDIFLMLLSERNFERELNQKVILPEFCIFGGSWKTVLYACLESEFPVLEVLIVTCGQPDQVNNARVSVKGLSTGETGEHDCFEFVSNGEQDCLALQSGVLQDEGGNGLLSLSQGLRWFLFSLDALTQLQAKLCSHFPIAQVLGTVERAGGLESDSLDSNPVSATY